MSDFLREKHHEAVSKQLALIQGVTASAIAFAIHQTSSRTWDWSLLPIGLAILVWAVGFGAGIVNGHAKQTAIKSNIHMLDALKKQQGDRHQIASDMLSKSNAKAQLTYQILLWSLLVGAILYVLGHGIYIWEQSKKVPAAASAIQQPSVVPVPTPQPERPKVDQAKAVPEDSAGLPPGKTEKVDPKNVVGPSQ